MRWWVRGFGTDQVSILRAALQESRSQVPHRPARLEAPCRYAASILPISAIPIDQHVTKRPTKGRSELRRTAKTP